MPVGGPGHRIRAGRTARRGAVVRGEDQEHLRADSDAAAEKAQELGDRDKEEEFADAFTVAATEKFAVAYTDAIAERHRVAESEYDAKGKSISDARALSDADAQSICFAYAEEQQEEEFTDSVTNPNSKSLAGRDAELIARSDGGGESIAK